ncbi:hypothetical protein A5792_28550 [Mycolicibacterium peregrinum]|uniref:ESX-1 secretion-associated protein n=1 Tax=Mycolicibacterium peregrinum TaxID=43304 RepID=A0A1A0QT52_MYCPR|nr:hypothetical protein A5792_28550 [Mycolicibacterium peregrinum]
MSMQVTPDGLRLAAGSDESTAVALTDRAGLLGSSGAGATVSAVEAVYAALACVRTDQTTYLQASAESLRSGAVNYEESDVEGARGIARTM